MGYFLENMLVSLPFGGSDTNFELNYCWSGGREKIDRANTKENGQLRPPLPGNDVTAGTYSGK